jgi:hypothetical protein
MEAFRSYFRQSYDLPNSPRPKRVQV